jgi:hypothetical protein
MSWIRECEWEGSKSSSVNLEQRQKGGKSNKEFGGKMQLEKQADYIPHSDVLEAALGLCHRREITSWNPLRALTFIINVIAISFFIILRIFFDISSLQKYAITMYFKLCTTALIV